MTQSKVKKEDLSEKESKMMFEQLKKHENNDDRNVYLPKENENGIYVYNKDNIPWSLEKIFMPDMMAVLREHLIYDKDDQAFFCFDYKENMICEFKDSKVNILIDVEKQQISAHFSIMIFDIESIKKYPKPFSFFLDFDDISEFSIAYYKRLEKESNMDIKVAENTIKVTKRYKKGNK